MQVGVAINTACIAAVTAAQKAAAAPKRPCRRNAGTMSSIDFHVICGGGNLTVADSSQRAAAKKAKPALVHCIKATVSQLIFNKSNSARFPRQRFSQQILHHSQQPDDSTPNCPGKFLAPHSIALDSRGALQASPTASRLRRSDSSA